MLGKHVTKYIIKKTMDWSIVYNRLNKLIYGKQGRNKLIPLSSSKKQGRNKDFDKNGWGKYEDFG